MNVLPGESVDLDIKEVTVEQFRVYASSRRTEMSINKIEAYIAGRSLVSIATLSLHGILHQVADTCIGVCQEFVLDHLAEEIITSSMFETAIEAGLKLAITGAIDFVEYAGNILVRQFKRTDGIYTAV